jgi:hypothetical protein
MLFHGGTFVPPVLSVLLRGGSSIPASAEHLPPAAGLLLICLPTAADNFYPADIVLLHVVIVVIAVAAVLPAVIFDSVLAMAWHCYLFQPCPILGAKGRK